MGHSFFDWLKEEKHGGIPQWPELHTGAALPLRQYPDKGGVA